MKTFFFKYGEWGIKKSVFSYQFQKCKFDLSKKCTKKVLANKQQELVKTHFFSFVQVAPSIPYELCLLQSPFSRFDSFLYAVFLCQLWTSEQ
jgi:hypothetical protein